MNTPDIHLYELHKKRIFLVKELIKVDDEINMHLWDRYSLRSVPTQYNHGAVIPGVTPDTIESEVVDSSE